ncbi:TPA: hypothetical protein N0F65_011173 [Lagenidium giganteum]|uniref:tRNA threonylcarbamoyladenosine biosynthesis protein TsaE n=1 Tax=Lagenidium giganteum TaxID=4803 RepID=A0AAV2Z6Z6_9STRA|nr:TPA: hypothetical protein N0F65_011173 [Lagenidium giganteum]
MFPITNRKHIRLVDMRSTWMHRVVRARCRSLATTTPSVRHHAQSQPLMELLGNVHTTCSQEEMERMGARLAAGRRPGDIIFLKGDLGVGKTCFARGFVRALVEDDALQVTSPTYLLLNTYDASPRHGSSLIYHVDLYRLEKVEEKDKVALGLADAFTHGISLVEWPCRFDDASVPADRLDVHIRYGADDPSTRRIEFTAHGPRWNESA